MAEYKVMPCGRVGCQLQVKEWPAWRRGGIAWLLGVGTGCAQRGRFWSSPAALIEMIILVTQMEIVLIIRMAIGQYLGRTLF